MGHYNHSMGAFLHLVHGLPCHPAMVRFKAWCDENLSHQEKEVVSQKIGYVIPHKNDDQRLAYLAERIPGYGGWCEPFRCYPKIFNTVYTLSRADPDIQGWERVAPVELVETDSEFSVRIGGLTIHSKSDWEEESLTLSFKCSKSRNSVTRKWYGADHYKRIELKSILMGIQSDDSTVVEFQTHGRLYHSNGLHDLVSKVLNGGYKGYFKRVNCTVAGFIADAFFCEESNLLKFCV